MGRLVTVCMILALLAGCVASTQPTPTPPGPSRSADPRVPAPPTPAATDQPSPAASGAPGSTAPASSRTDPPATLPATAQTPDAYPQFAPPTELGPGGHEVSLALAPDGHHVAACAPPPNVGGPRQDQVYLSADDGATWAASTTIAATDPRAALSGYGLDCDVAYDAGGTLYVTEIGGEGPVQAVAVAASPDNGATWPTVSVAAGPPDVAAGLNVVNRPWLTAGAAGTVHLVYQTSGTAGTELEYAHTTDGGASWSAPVVMARGPGLPQSTLVADGQSLWVAYHNATSGPTEMLVAASGDGGASWATHLATRSVGAPQMYPALARDAGGILYMAWSEGGASPGLRLSLSKDAGATWSSPLLVATPVLAMGATVAGGARGQAVLAVFGSEPGTTPPTWSLTWARVTDADTHPLVQTATTTRSPIARGPGFPPEYSTLRLGSDGRMRIVSSWSDAASPPTWHPFFEAQTAGAPA